MSSNGPVPDLDSVIDRIKEEATTSRIVAGVVGGGIGVNALSNALSDWIQIKRPENVDPEKYLVPEMDLPDRWVAQKNSIKVPLTVKNLPLSIYTSGQMYSDEKLAERVSGILPNELSVPLVSMFACRVNVFSTGFGGNLLFGFANPKRVMDSADGAVKGILTKDYGIENLDRVKGDQQDRQPEQAERHREYSGEYIIRTPQEVELPNGKIEKIMIEALVPIRVFYSCWSVEDSEDLMLVGGVYPERSFIQSPATVTDDFNKGIDVWIDIDLGFDPDDARSRMVEQTDSHWPAPKDDS